MAASHHVGRGFRNPWPDSEPRGLRDVLRWSWQRRRQALAPDPMPGGIPQAQPLFAASANDGGLSATWVGHATVFVQLGRMNVLTDPIWSERASPVSFAGPRRFVPAGVELERLPPINVALISHNHSCHRDRPTVQALAQRMPEIEWLVPLGLARTLRRWGAQRVKELDWGQDVRLETSNGQLYAACVPAQHFSARSLGDRGRTLWCSWVVGEQNTRVLFAGDTAYHPEFAMIGERYGPFTLLMLPIGAYEPRWFMRTVHMNPPEALRAYAQLSGKTANPPILLPIHWGTFCLTDESPQ